MFGWKEEQKSIDPLFRRVYALQLVAVIGIWAGLFFIWWDAPEPLTIWRLLERSTRELRRIDPRFLAQPLLLLWLLWPSLLLSSARSLTGLLVQPVSFRWLALSLWVVSMLPLIHYYINYGGETISEHSPLKDGVIGDGFWVTGVASVALGVLLFIETLIREPEVFPVRQPLGGAVQDAEALWQGKYLACPVCGTLNEPNARVCHDCKSLLFRPDDVTR